MAEALIGTNGYSYDDWRGVFYPAELGKDDFLRYYALFFPFVELGFTARDMPTRRGLSWLASRTPAGFGFSLAAYRGLTHEPGPGWRDDAAAFVSAAAPLLETGRLAAVVARFPSRFRYLPDNRAWLARLLAALSPLPLAVEFGAADWDRPSVSEELDRLGVATVTRDGRAGFAELATTGPFAYLRMSGRGEGDWWADPERRYGYLYSDDELAGAAQALRRLPKGGKAYVVFGNHAGGNAALNARALGGLSGPARP